METGRRVKRYDAEVGERERREARRKDESGRGARGTRSGCEETLASHRSSLEKRRKGAFLRRVAVEAGRGLYSVLAPLHFILSPSRAPPPPPLATLIELDVYVLAGPNLMNARGCTSVNGEARSFFVATARRTTPRPRFADGPVASGFDRRAVSAPIKHARDVDARERKDAPSRNLYESLHRSFELPPSILLFRRRDTPYPCSRLFHAPGACSFRDATCLEALIEPGESNVCVRETNLANTNVPSIVAHRKYFGLVALILFPPSGSLPLSPLFFSA